jgi:methylated-DNA-[protein]-cysteine S-methyltransferase
MGMAKTSAMGQAVAWNNTPLGPLWAEMKDGKIAALHWGKAPVHAVEGANETLMRYFKKNKQQFDIHEFMPVGTPFQRKVWQALCEIPWGQTTTYGELAAKVGSSARAVGGAVGANPIPILIPCHRVMGKNGALTGFSAPGGLDTKRWLLQHEGILKA